MKVIKRGMLPKSGCCSCRRERRRGLKEKAEEGEPPKSVGVPAEVVVEKEEEGRRNIRNLPELLLKEKREERG